MQLQLSIHRINKGKTQQFSVIVILYFIGNIRTEFAETNTTWPDVAILLLSLHVNSDGGAIFRRGLNMKSSYFEHFKSLKFQDGFTLIPVLLHPYSRGKIKLRSKNPFEKPVFIANYFEDPRDILTLQKAIDITFSLVKNTRKFQKYGAKFFNKINPACVKFKPYSQQYWECLSRYFTYQIYHDVGTCKVSSI